MYQGIRVSVSVSVSGATSGVVDELLVLGIQLQLPNGGAEDEIRELRRQGPVLWLAPEAHLVDRDDDGRSYKRGGDFRVLFVSVCLRHTNPGGASSRGLLTLFVRRGQWPWAFNGSPESGFLFLE